MPQHRKPLSIRTAPMALPEFLTTGEMESQKYRSGVSDFFQQSGASDIYGAGEQFNKYKEKYAYDDEGNILGNYQAEKMEGNIPFGNEELQRRIDTMSEMGQKYGVGSFTTDPKLGKKGLLGMLARGWDFTSGGRAHYLPSMKGKKSQVYIPQGEKADDKKLQMLAERLGGGRNWKMSGGIETDQGNLGVTSMERKMLEEVAHAQQQQENTKSWKGAFRNPLQIAMSAIGQPLTSVSNVIGKATNWSKPSQALHKATGWISGYNRPKAMEYEAHRELSPKLQQEYAQMLLGRGSKGFMKKGQSIQNR